MTTNNTQNKIEEMVRIGWSLSGEGFNHEYAGDNPDDIETIDSDGSARKKVKNLFHSFEKQIKEEEKERIVEKIEDRYKLLANWKNKVNKHTDPYLVKETNREMSILKNIINLVNNK